MTVIVVGPRMTWLFVRTSPVLVRTIPVPAAFAFSYARFVVTSTTPRVTGAGAAFALPAKTPAAATTAAARRRILCIHY